MIPGAFPVASTPVAETSDSLKADIVATFPALTADLAAIAPVAAVGAATLPALTAALTAIAPVSATATATFPALTAAIVAVAPISAVILATLPALTASITIRTETRRALRDWQQCPRPAAGAWASSCRAGSLRDGPGDGV